MMRRMHLFRGQGKAVCRQVRCLKIKIAPGGTDLYMCFIPNKLS